MMTDLWDDSRLKESSLLKYNVHTPLQNLPVDKLKTISEKLSLPLGLMLFNLNGDMNVGMAIRTAVILGCSDVYVIGRRKYDRRPEVGAKNYIQIHRHQSIESNFFADNKLLPILVEQGGTPLEAFSFKSYLPKAIPAGWKVVFVVGSESHGLPKQLLQALHAPIVTISQYGILRSLNVAIAASILLYEYTRQWRESVAI